MSMGGKPPDPTATANTQAAYNLQAGTESQAGSLFNQETPWGNINYQQTGTGPGGIPLYTGKTTLSSAQQQILDLLQGGQTTAGGQAGRLLAGADYGAKSPADVVGGMTSGTTQALLGKETSYLDPVFTKQTNELDTKLRNQGLFPSPSSDPSNPNTWGPYEKAMNQLRQDQGQTVTGFLASAEPAAYSQSVSSYLMPLQMALQELGLAQPQGPGAIKTASAPTAPLSTQPPNYSQLAEQNYAQQVQQQSNLWSALSKLGVGALSIGAAPFTGGLSLAAMPAMFASAPTVAGGSF